MDIENVLEFCKNKRSLRINYSTTYKDSKIGNNSKNSFILIGHSLGSAPSVHIASKISSNNNLIRTLILISPIASGIKFFDENKTDNIGLEKNDIFCNIKKIIEVKVPVFLIHGMIDDIIPVKHSQEMLKYVKTKFEWLPKNGDHGNILTKYRTKFFQKCKIFLDNLCCYERQESNINSISTENSFNLSNFHLKENEGTNKSYKTKKTNITNKSNRNNKSNNNNNNYSSDMYIIKRGSVLCYSNFSNKISRKFSPKYENNLDYDLINNKNTNDINNIHKINEGISYNFNTYKNQIFEENQNDQENLNDSNNDKKNNKDIININEEIDFNYIEDKTNIDNFIINNTNNEKSILHSFLNLKDIDDSLLKFEFNESKHLKNSYCLDKSNIENSRKDYSSYYESNNILDNTNSEYNCNKDIDDYYNRNYDSPPFK